MVEFGGICVFNAEVVNNDDEGDVACFMVEQSVSGGALVVAVFGEECAELLVGQYTSLR